MLVVTSFNHWSELVVITYLELRVIGLPFHQRAFRFLLGAQAIGSFVTRVETLVAASRGIMFEKSLQDLVKGIRANKRDPSAFISQAIAECKTGQSARAARSLTRAPPLGETTPLTRPITTKPPPQARRLKYSQGAARPWSATWRPRTPKL